MNRGFRSLIQGRMNQSGYAVCEGEDKEIAAKLAGPDVDEQWAAQHIERCKAEIHGTWSIDEFGRREVHKCNSVGITRIDIHHVNGQLDYRAVNLVPEQR